MLPFLSALVLSSAFLFGFVGTASADCSEVSRDTFFGGSNLVGLDDIVLRDDGTAESWKCLYEDGTVVLSTCTPVPVSPESQ
jgi:hypothetical protein